jgi:hypothetical protein
MFFYLHVGVFICVLISGSVLSVARAPCTAWIACRSVYLRLLLRGHVGCRGYRRKRERLHSQQIPRLHLRSNHFYGKYTLITTVMI